MHETDRISIRIDHGIADVRLTRPDKRNALDVPMLEGIAHAGERLSGDPGLRTIILSGEGAAFCAGIDLGSFAGSLPDLRVRSHGDANLFQHAAMLWRALPVPVIAAIHGPCFGGGLQIALGADIRIAAPDARLSLMEIKWGLVPDMGAFTLARGLVRDDVLRELIYTGRQVDAEEAASIGLVTRVVDDPRAEALALAERIAQGNPDAIRKTKALLGIMREADGRMLLAAESAAQADLLGSANQREAVAANMEKRQPRFANPS
jgi:enoyl-CoA hydratase/carnithine racemase